MSSDDRRVESDSRAASNDAGSGQRDLGQRDLGQGTELWEQVYVELRKLAAVRLAQEQPGQTLQPTALVNEAWLRLNAGQAGNAWQNRAHFFAAAAESMRRILVDRARQKRGPKAGGRLKRVELEAAVCDNGQQFDINQEDQLLAINEALEHLARESPVKAELVKLRFFAGLDHQDAAMVLGISRATADRYWAYAKAYLYDALLDPEEK